MTGELQRWAERPPAKGAPAVEVAAALVAVGEALDSGVELPCSLREWMKNVDRTDIERALAGSKLELGREAAHARRSIARIALSRSWDLGSLDLAKLGPSSTGGSRDAHVSLDDDVDRGRPDLDEPDLAVTDALERAARREAPDDEIVTGYVTHGALARYVEGVAAKNAAFQRELETCIGALEDAGEPISAAARAWRERIELGPQSTVVTSDPAGPSHVAAAVDASLPPAPVETAKIVALPSRGPNMARIAQIALAAMVLLGVGGGAWAIRSSQEETARIQALKEREIAETQAQLERLEAELAAQNQQIAVARAEAASARDEAERARARAKLAAAEQQQRKTQANIASIGAPAREGASSRAAPAPTPKPACTCQAGDPLCSCL